MDFAALKKLKSGSDVRGVAVGENTNLTDGAAAAVAKAFCAWLAAKYNIVHPKIAVGNDSRISAPRLKAAVTAALTECGADVVYTGLSSTPSMFILLKESDFACDGSVMITASHLPYDRNGLKFFTAGGGLSGGEIDEILKIASEGKFPRGSGKYTERAFMDEYSAILVKKVEAECGKLPLKGKKIIVDAGNGAGGFFAEKVLKPLGADTSGSRFLDPDGLFPNHVPNPEDKEAIDGLAAAVVAEKADLGIIFDTDVDRAACVDSHGNEINRNALIALLSAIILPKRGGTIVTDSVTSPHLTEFIESLGGKHLRYKRGYRNVIDKCRELNDSGEYSPLAIETSGHAAFPENYYLDDGAYLMTKILTFAAKNGDPGGMIAKMKRPAEELEIRIGFNAASRDFKSEGAKVIEDLKARVPTVAGAELSEDNYEGARYSKGGTTTLVRMSVHDPVMPINFESDLVGGIAAAAWELYEFLRGYGFLEVKNLKTYLDKTLKE